MNMIYHHPLPVQCGAQSGSGVRPYRMREAFEKIGCKVLDLTGYSQVRRSMFSAAIDGVAPSFMYSENSTMPLGLTDKHHLPMHYYFELNQFKSLSRRGVPIGVFYRDFHWRFPVYDKMTTPLKRMIAKLFYLMELEVYRRYASVIFLPTIEMRKYLPQLDSLRVIALPPGCLNIIGERTPRAINGRLKAVYVGGIVPPIYDLTPTAELLNSCLNIELNLVCRKNDLTESDLLAKFRCPDRLRMTHVSGSDLEDKYSQADIFVWLRRDCEYLDYAMPVKIFEAMAHGLPVLTMGENPVSKFVRDNKIGWVVTGNEEAVALSEKIARGEIDLGLVSKNVLAVAKKNTWEERAKLVAAILSK
ncbi:MAG: glycosyltransferase [Fibrobacteres bacterium]|nr:glycosyltransferase [Fibrobacterota bacterium]